MLQPSPAPADPTSGLRAAIARLPSSKIREIAHAGMGRDDIIPLWFGEPDTPTPKFICDAAAAALAAGDTFYQPNPGIHELRAALADYMNGLYGTRLAGGQRDRLRIRHERADAGDAGAGRSGRRGRDHHAILAQSAGAAADPLRPGPERAAHPRESRLAPRSRPPARCLRSAHARDLPELAQQPDRLDDVGRAATGRARVRAPARHLDRERRGLCADRLRSPARAVVPRAGGARGSGDRGQQLLQDLVDDRLAAGVDHRARRARPRASRC